MLKYFIHSLSTYRTKKIGIIGRSKRSSAFRHPESWPLLLPLSFLAASLCLTRVHRGHHRSSLIAHRRSVFHPSNFPDPPLFLCNAQQKEKAKDNGDKGAATKDVKLSNDFSIFGGRSVAS